MDVVICHRGYLDSWGERKQPQWARGLRASRLEHRLREPDAPVREMGCWKEPRLLMADLETKIACGTSEAVRRRLGYGRRPLALTVTETAINKLT